MVLCSPLAHFRQVLFTPQSAWSHMLDSFALSSR